MSAYRLPLQKFTRGFDIIVMDANLIHKALANPLRREILAWLRTPDEVFPGRYFDFRYGVPANAIHARSGLAQSTISAHIASLAAAGLVVCTRVGQWTLVTRNETVIRAFAEELRACL